MTSTIVKKARDVEVGDVVLRPGRGPHDIRRVTVLHVHHWISFTYGARQSDFHRPDADIVVMREDADENSR